jgi:hypothetical protein
MSIVGRLLLWQIHPVLVVIVLLIGASAELDTASASELLTDGDLSIRLDTTIQFTGLRRLTKPQEGLLANPNSDDGDRSFSSGDVSNRTDVFTEFDANYGTAGLRLSGAGWYDPVYRGGNANNSPATFNPYTVPSDHFTQAVQGLEGLDAEVLDAFVHDTFDIGGDRVGVRLGRHTLIWGESLFFGENGIAIGQAPIDFIKASAVPNTPARELFLPVNQLSASVQLRPGLSLEAYTQFEWRQDRLPGVASYFSTTDDLDVGGERIIASPGSYFYRGPDQNPGATGQFGAAIHATIGNADWGLYALRYNARSATVTTAGCGGPCSLPGQIGAYRLVYARGIDVFGISASGFIGNDILAGELSLRRGAPLLARDDLFQSPIPRGDTGHGQISIVGERPANALWDRISLQAELAANTLLATTSGESGRDPTTTRTAAAIQGQLTLDYYHLLPALDLSPFVAASYGITGQSSVDPEMVGGTGDVTIGLRATYRTVWHIEVRLTDYIGSANRQPLADRNFMAFNVRRTF